MVLFHDFEVDQDEFEKLQKDMNSFTQYKFSKARKSLMLNRLSMLTMLCLVDGT